MPRPPFAVLAAAFLFNVGQGVLRPAMPLYLERTFHANYRMVTLIPVVFGLGKWIANLPAGYLATRMGGPLMIGGLIVIAVIDVASVTVSRYDAFLVLRGAGGLGWAMFATVATTAMIATPASHRRGRAVSLLMVSESSGLLLGSAAGGWVYQGLGAASPFLFEAGCMAVAAVVVSPWATHRNDASATTAEPTTPWTTTASRPVDRRHSLRTVLRTPGAVLMGLTNALLIAIQTGIIVFLFPLYFVTRGRVGPEASGVLVSVGVLGRLTALWTAGGWSDRYGRMRVLVPGLVAYAALLATFSLVTHPIALAIASFSIGAVGGIVAAVPTAFVSDQVPRDAQGIAIGWLRTMTDGGQILGPLIMGAVADMIDLSASFVLAAVLLVAASLACLRLAHAMSSQTVSAGP